MQPYNSEDVFSKSAYGFASYRGYIWSKTIPKLKSTWLLGTGMDHFVLTFPNHDYVSKAQINKLGVVYNKPHNWYLQIGVESGLISMFSIVIMLIYILAEGVNRGRKYICHPPATNETNIYKTMMLGLGVAVAGYCFMNIFNDQMIVTAPVFWIVLGAYAGISRSLKEDVR